MVPELATADYRPRIADGLLRSKLASAGAVEIRGPTLYTGVGRQCTNPLRNDASGVQRLRS